MTERGARHCHRDEMQFQIGPSQLRWQEDALVIDIDEWSVPWPHRVRGQVRLQADTWFKETLVLDPQGKHRWGPLAPSARVSVSLEQPAQHWQGQAYLDANEGDEPIDRACHEWDWSRAILADGSTAVIYDVQQKQGKDRLLGLRFTPSGSLEEFAPPPRQELELTGWRIPRRMRSEGEAPVQVIDMLEDTPFYERSEIGRAHV